MRSLIIALALISGFMVAEVIGGIISGSLALLADAGHMITDAAAIGLALFALAVSRRRASRGQHPATAEPRNILVNKYGISHATIQLEQSTRTCVEDHHVDNLVVVMHSDRESLRF